MSRQVETKVTIRLNRIQLEEIERAASSSGMYIVDYIRQCATTAAQRINRPAQITANAVASAEWYQASNNPQGEAFNDMRTV